MSVPKQSSAVLAILLLTVFARGSSAEWYFNGLGTLGGEESLAAGVSADGRVVVGASNDAGGVQRAFRWEGGQMVALHSHPFSSSWASAVSADGSVVVVNADFEQVLSWQSGILVPLWTGGDGGKGRDVSADGSVVVGYSGAAWPPEPDPNRVYWTATRWERDAPDHYQRYFLHSLIGDQSYAYGISPDASVIVGRASGIGGYPWYQAFRWEDGVMTGLGTLGGARSGAYDVSADGSVIVGWADRADGANEAFRWEDGTMSGLGVLPGDWEESFAGGVSADGSLIVGYASQSPPEGPSLVEAFIWDETHGMRPLSALLEQHGVDLSDWDLSQATDISADGRVIVGKGYHISANRYEGWIATIPEPSTLTALLTLAAPALLVHLRRRRRKHG